jgi:hypothetical protein
MSAGLILNNQASYASELTASGVAVAASLVAITSPATGA